MKSWIEKVVCGGKAVSTSYLLFERRNFPTLSNTAGLILDSCKEFNFFSSVKLLKLAFADVFSNSNLRQVCDVM